MEKQGLVSKPSEFHGIIDDILASFNDDRRALVIALKGDLGAGKTTFTQELGKKLGVREPITSPTFTIMKQYLLPKGQFEKLIHIDAYRIESEDETGPLHLETVLTQPKTIVCIEWPERIQSIVPPDAVKIYISILEGETRQVEVSYL